MAIYKMQASTFSVCGLPNPDGLMNMSIMQAMKKHSTSTAYIRQALQGYVSGKRPIST